MIKIALCDDNRKFLEELDSEIQLFLHSRSILPVIAHFTSSFALIACIADGERYDLYILDIWMPGSSGLEAARVVRTYQPNVPLLFLTAYPEYAAEGYKVAALRYLYKDHLRQELPDALDCALKQIEMLDKTGIKVQYYQNYTRVFLRDILFMSTRRSIPCKL